MRDFGSQLKQAGGGEGERCLYTYRLDTYGCGCQHDCAYCYAKSLLDFRKLWDADSPSVAKPEEISKAVRKVPRGEVVRLGGMTDCFMPAELTHRATYKAIRKLNARRIPYLIVTKGAIVARPEYMRLYDPELAHFQVSITATDNRVSERYERASSVEKRLEALRALSEAGFDASLRVSPLIPGNVDWARLEGRKVLVEFLRVNSWVAKWLPLDYSRWSVSEGGYKHLPLEYKKRLMGEVRNFDQVSVCEDVPSHYEYWRRNVNSNPNDCCNLERRDIGSTGA